MKQFAPEGVFVAVTRADGGLSIKNVLMVARGSSLEHGATWIDQAAGVWARNPTQDVLEAEVRREFPDAQRWRVIDASHVPARDDYRDALADTGASIAHDMPRARQKHRELLRHAREHAFRELDGQWLRAVGQGNQQEADRIEARRQAWREAPADPRIEAALSIDELKRLQRDG